MWKILIISQIFTKYARSNPWFYFLGVVFFPVSLFVPLLLLANPGLRVDIFIGSAICATTIMTISDISDIISHDKYANSLGFFLTRPIRLYQYIMGVGLSTLVYNLIGLGVIFIMGFFLLGFKLAIWQMLTVALIILTGWMISCSLGFLIGMWGPRDPRVNTSLASILGYVLTFMAPIYYPIEVLPNAAQAVSLCLYTTNLSLIGKWVIRQPEIGPGLLPVWIVAGYLLLSLLLLARMTRWKAQ